MNAIDSRTLSSSYPLVEDGSAMFKLVSQATQSTQSHREITLASQVLAALLRGRQARSRWLIPDNDATEMAARHALAVIAPHHPPARRTLTDHALPPIGISPLNLRVLHR